TYDEHGGFYDHVPPPMGVPSPGDSSGWLARLIDGLLHRKSEAFDFTLLGPRVPAVVVSPHIRAGTVDNTVRDHASVPATLRAVFMPDAPPLTRRDAWSPPFHDVVNLDRPRRGDELPDLSAYVGGPAEGAQVEVTLDHDPGDTDQDLPPYYRDFVTQAEWVRRHLIAVGEPEAVHDAFLPSASGAPNVTRVFRAAARRHRDDASRPDRAQAEA
ncbi:MAG: alkaline phosphatase family protein, partial [Mycobacteriales bacterium]